ncbi:MAG: TerD family protein [Alphaproteobacteria bacterium]|nr:TerD family protein [Alphaproteobacteria bacterium]
MDDDFFDTRHSGKALELGNNTAYRGDDINLLEKDPTLKKIIIAAGWDVNVFDSDAPDLDLSLILIGKDGKTRMDEDFVFYNNPQGSGGAVKHHGDSRTGAGDGDDETISLEFSGIPFDVMQILIVLSIYKGDEKRQDMGMVRNSFVRIVNADNDHELTRYLLDEDLKGHPETAMIVGSLDRFGPKWHFRPLGEMVEGGLREVAMRYGLIIANQ